MRILTDENVPRSVLTWLRTTGHDVTSASELGIGEPDTRWLMLAESEQRLILTSDKDFGDLVFRDHLTSFGIILLRLDELAQDTDATLQSGQPYYYESGQVIVPDVTITAITQIIPHLVEDGYLERRSPVREAAAL